MNATAIQPGDTVKRLGDEDMGNGFGVEVGDVVKKSGARCQVAWRDRQVPNFYRPEETVTRKGKRTWINQARLVKVTN